jgi:hypothetical protein
MSETVLLTQESRLGSNPDLTGRVAGAFQCSLTWIQDHPTEQIRERLPDSCRTADAASDLEAIAAEKQMLSRDGRMTPEMHEAAVRISGVPGQQILLRHTPMNFLNRRLPFTDRSRTA